MVCILRTTPLIVAKGMEPQVPVDRDASILRYGADAHRAPPLVLGS